MLVDVHAHLDDDQFKEDLDQVIERAEKAGLISIITNGTNPQSNTAVLNLSKKYKIVHAALGIYPITAHEMSEEEAQEQMEFMKKNRKDILALGEVGLDLKFVNTLEKQQKIFEDIIELSKKLKKPLIVHSRKAESETLDILESLSAKKVIMHCFTPNMKIVKRAENLGFFLSVPPVITRLQHFQELVKQTSLKKLLTETDCPYLSPYKEKRNEPAFVVETIRKIAEIKKIEVEETKKIIFSNYQKIFSD